MRLHQHLSAVTLAVLLPFPAMADGHADAVEELYAVLQFDELIDVMREEGLSYGEQIATDMFGGRATGSWTTSVDQIYAADAMSETILSGLTDALNGKDIAPITAFFESDLGQEIVTLEIAARRAFLDEDVEEASNEAAALALIDETPRAQLLTEFVETNDLVETNVVGAMNANFAFYIGLMEGGGFAGSLSQDEILADVWSQEDDIRQNTTEWVYSYGMLAYQPLSDDDLQDYIAFSQTTPGQDLNAALFAAFDGMFEDISRALGRAASVEMIGDEL